MNPSERKIPDLAIFPGGDLVTKGLKDLESGDVTEEALLVSLASTRLEPLGLRVPKVDVTEPSYEIALYTLIEERNPKGAYADYKALVRRIVSFAQSYSRTKIRS